MYRLVRAERVTTLSLRLDWVLLQGRSRCASIYLYIARYGATGYTDCVREVNKDYYNRRHLYVKNF